LLDSIFEFRKSESAIKTLKHVGRHIAVDLEIDDLTLQREKGLHNDVGDSEELPEVLPAHQVNLIPIDDTVSMILEELIDLRQNLLDSVFVRRDDADFSVS
jgi:hypothetical protein